MTSRVYISAGAICLALAGCASNSRMAPVTDISTGQSATTIMAAPTATQRARDWRPPTHVVQKGETLYSIALEYGLDYRELAQWNHLNDINHIQVGQTLQLSAGVPPAAGVGSASVAPNAAPGQPVAAIPEAAHPQASVQVTPLPADNQAAHASSTGGETGLNWIWPTRGPLLGGADDTTGEGKGIDIGGQRGQSIVAAAAGKVVYSGSGLHGYGNMVIIKHNAMYLTAYAHNQKVLVKEGQIVSQGQPIAEMGDSDAKQVELHFEIRQMGKPVDPIKYLPVQNQ